MPILIGMSAWLWAAYGAAGTATLVGTYYGGVYAAKAMRKRAKRNLNAALFDAFFEGGKDGLEAYLLETGMAKTDHHLQILMKHLVPKLAEKAMKAEKDAAREALKENIRVAEKADKAAEKAAKARAEVRADVDEDELRAAGPMRTVGRRSVEVTPDPSLGG